jgi:uncharacterized membrane protein YkgB
MCVLPYRNPEDEGEMAAEKVQIPLRLSVTEHEHLCKFARDLGGISLNTAIKLLINYVHRGTISSGDVRVMSITCVSKKVN